MIKNALTEDFFFYLACLLITFNIFPFDLYGMGSGKNLAIIPLILYLLQSIFRHRVFFPNTYLNEFICIFILLLISWAKSIIVYGDTIGITSSISMWMSYAIFIISLSVFFKNADRKKVLAMLKFLFASFKISLFFGILEVIYFYVIPSNGFIPAFIRSFVRDGMYLEVQRLQFNFGEPGEAALLITCFFSMIVYSLHKMGYKFSRLEKIQIVMLYLLEAIYAKSMSFWMIAMAFVCSFCFEKIVHERSKKSLKLFILVPFLIFIAVTYIGSIDEVSLKRFQSIMLEDHQTAAQEDGSSATRIGLWFVSAKMYVDYPLLGVGWGNFAQEFPKYLDKIPKYFITNEMLYKIHSNNHQSYSIYSTALTEGGIVGLVWMLFAFSKMKRKTFMQRVFVPLFWVICIQIIFIYKFEYCFIMYLLSSTKYQKIVYDEYSLS